MVGLVSNPETFCTLKLTQAYVNESETKALPPMSDASDADVDPEQFEQRVKEIESEGGREIVYDLKPLSAAEEGRMVGPIANNPWVLNQTREARFYVSVCHRDPWSDVCVDAAGKSLNTYACKVGDSDGDGDGGGGACVPVCLCIRPGVFVPMYSWYEFRALQCVCSCTGMCVHAYSFMLCTCMHPPSGRVRACGD